MSKSFSIGHLRFKTKEAAKAHYRAILYRDVLGTEITGDDVLSAQALLFARPEKLEEIGDRKVVRYLRKMHPHNTPCLYAELDDGVFLHISFKNWIDETPFDATT